ncbi:MAG: acetolactate synthase [Planctomycetaceae bacterium]|nr:acetolactate synthase [Planctomycetaceae bacterium]
MPSRRGGESVVNPETMQGRGWPCLRQFVVFLENRVGRLSELMRAVESLDVRVLALSIVDSVDCANVRLIFNNADRARERLELASFLFSESDLVGVELPEDDKPFDAICTALLKAELNIHHASYLRYRRDGRSAVAMYVDDVDLATRTLEEAGLRVVTEGDLLDQDDYL